jgi:nucleoside-triphosphatase THEP1
MISMTPCLPDFDLLDLDPNLLAAVIYRAEDDVDTLLSDFAIARLAAGDRLGGIVQRNIKDADGKKIDMRMIDLMSGREIGISQALGQGSQSCKLDSSGLTEASTAVGRAIQSDVDLIVINKFAMQEANGRGLRNEFAECILTGRPTLTAVPEKCLDAWAEFTGDRGTTLFCARRVVDAWWQDVSSRAARRAHPWRLATEGAEPLYRS